MMVQDLTVGRLGPLLLGALLLCAMGAANGAQSAKRIVEGLVSDPTVKDYDISLVLDAGPSPEPTHCGNLPCWVRAQQLVLSFLAHNKISFGLEASRAGVLCYGVVNRDAYGEEIAAAVQRGRAPVENVGTADYLIGLRPSNVSTRVSRSAKECADAVCASAGVSAEDEGASGDAGTVPLGLCSHHLTGLAPSAPIIDTTTVNLVELGTHDLAYLTEHSVLGLGQPVRPEKEQNFAHHMRRDTGRTPSLDLDANPHARVLDYIEGGPLPLDTAIDTATQKLASGPKQHRKVMVVVNFAEGETGGALSEVSQHALNQGIHVIAVRMGSTDVGPLTTVAGRQDRIVQWDSEATPGEAVDQVLSAMAVTIPQNGGWSEWLSDTCVCKNRTIVVRRLCDNPLPNNIGNQCGRSTPGRYDNVEYSGFSVNTHTQTARCLRHDCPWTPGGGKEKPGEGQEGGADSDSEYETDNEDGGDDEKTGTAKPRPTQENTDDEATPTTPWDVEPSQSYTFPLPDIIPEIEPETDSESAPRPDLEPEPEPEPAPRPEPEPVWPKPYPPHVVGPDAPGGLPNLGGQTIETELEDDPNAVDPALKQAEGSGGGSKKWLYIGIGIGAACLVAGIVGVGVYLVTKGGTGAAAAGASTIEVA